MSTSLVDKLVLVTAFVVGAVSAQSCHDCPPEPADLTPGEYEVVSAPERLAFAIGASAVVEHDDLFGQVTIEYDDEEGNHWSVTYH